MLIIDLKTKFKNIINKTTQLIIKKEYFASNPQQTILIDNKTPQVILIIKFQAFEFKAIYRFLNVISIFIITSLTFSNVKKCNHTTKKSMPTSLDNENFLI